MKIAMPYMEGKVNGHFGASREFVIIEAENGKITGKKILANEALHNHGGLALMLKAEGTDVVIAGGIGRPMAEALYWEGLEVITGASGEVEEVAEKFLDGTLVTNPDSCACGGGHHD